MQIRDFKKEDAAPASSLIRECFEKLDICGHTPKGIELQIAGNSPENLVKRAETTKYFVTVAHDEVVGIGGYDRQKIHTLFVDVSHHRKGIGKKLLDTILREAKKEGIKSLSTWSTMFAEPFYASAGFQRVGEISLPPGKKDIVLIEMVKKLG